MDNLLADTIAEGQEEDLASHPSEVLMRLVIEEDIPAELDAFVQLSRLGLFSEATKLFKRKLEPQLDLFPVVAEYADFLLEQGKYDLLSDFVDNVFESQEFQEEERQLLNLFRALSYLHTEGELKSALRRCREWRRSLPGSAEQLTETQVRSGDVFCKSPFLIGDRSYRSKSIFRS